MCFGAKFSFNKTSFRGLNMDQKYIYKHFLFYLPLLLLLIKLLKIFVAVTSGVLGVAYPQGIALDFVSTRQGFL